MKSQDALIVGGIAVVGVAGVAWFLLNQKPPPPTTSIMFNPSTAARGSSTVLSGTGFTANVMLEIGFMGVFAPFIMSNSTGGFTYNFMVSSTAPLGTITATVRDPSGKMASTMLTVTA